MDSLELFKTSAIPLTGRFNEIWDAEPFVSRVTSAEQHLGAIVVIDQAVANAKAGRFSLCLAHDRFATNAMLGASSRLLPKELGYLEDGDIIRINPRRGEVWVMFRRASKSNAILVTERCNSWCIMCSQPPKRNDDSFLIDAWLDAIALMDSSLEYIGFTGGEPTLLGDRFLELVTACREKLPQTGVHVLSNGRKFNYLSFAKALAETGHPNLTIGIPLYSDLAYRHDFIVQAEQAFDQTIRGIHNLARCGISVEVRVVLHRYSVGRLCRLSEYIARNLPFVCHVALMGFEPIGFGKTNFEALWIDPIDYQAELLEAVSILQRHSLAASIYNHPLCLLPVELWPLARQSISDWKNVFVAECGPCKLKVDCCGFFASASTKHSRGIRPFLVDLESN